LANLLKLDQEQESPPQSALNPIYQKVHTMACRETEFALKELISMCLSQSHIGIVDHPPQSTIMAANAAVNTVPALLALDFLLGGKAFERLRLANASACAAGHDGYYRERGVAKPTTDRFRAV
jgi:hypothetical protein